MNVAGVIAAIPRMDPKARQRVRDNADRWLELGPKQAAAAKDVLQALDAVEGREKEHAERHPAGPDRIGRIVEAFEQHPMSNNERLIVQVLLDNPGRPSEELARKAGWKGQSAWHLHFGAMCHARQHLLWPAPFDVHHGANFFTGILADFNARNRGFTLKPEAAGAFRRLGLAPKKKA